MRAPEQQRALVRATISRLKQLQAYRAAGGPVYLTTDPAWLVDMAINRRAGWAEDPHAFGSCQPVRGKLPRYATGDAQRHIGQLAYEINSRARVMEQRIGSPWRGYLLRALPDRFVRIGEDW